MSRLQRAGSSTWLQTCTHLDLQDAILRLGADLGGVHIVGLRAVANPLSALLSAYHTAVTTYMTNMVCLHSSRAQIQV